MLVLFFSSISDRSPDEEEDVFLLLIFFHPLDTLLELAGQCGHGQTRVLVGEPLKEPQVRIMTNVHRQIFEIVFLVHGFLDEDLGF